MRNDHITNRIHFSMWKSALRSRAVSVGFVQSQASVSAQPPALGIAFRLSFNIMGWRFLEYCTMIIQCTSKVVLSWRVAPANSDGNEAPIHISSKKRPTHPVWSASQPQQGNPNHQTHVPRQPNHTREGKESVWHVILFKEPNPTGSRPRDLFGLYMQQTKLC